MIHVCYDHTVFSWVYVFVGLYHRNSINLSSNGNTNILGKIGCFIAFVCVCVCVFIDGYSCLDNVDFFAKQTTSFAMDSMFLRIFEVEWSIETFLQ